MVQKTAFEVGDGKLIGIQPVHTFQFGDLGEGFFHPEKIGLVVGFDPEFASWSEGPMQSAKERRLNQAAWMVVAFWPRIRKENGGCGNRAVREEMFDQIRVFDAENADIGEVASGH